MVKLLVKSKKKKNASTGAQFRTYFTDVRIIVKGEEEKGKQLKTVNVRFDKTIDTKNIVRGMITCKDSDIDLPFKYQVVVKENGKESYPTIFIRKYESYEEKRTPSTIEFVLEEDTAETVIDEDEIEVTDETEED